MSKPAKQPRTQGQNEVMRTESVDLQTLSTKEERNPPTGTLPSATEKKKTHPKGHRVRNLDEDVWKAMDGQTFLHLSDIGNLSDVWVRPVEVEPSTTMYTTVKFQQIVDAPHLKRRYASCKMAIDDLLRMLHLNDCLQRDLQRIERQTFDEWLADKTAAFIKENGVTDATNRSLIANFVITYDREFSFCPTFLKDCSFFFRKISYHSYKTKSTARKFINPSMVKCRATRGTFEYMIEGRLFPVPNEWWDAETVPDSQPI